MTNQNGRPRRTGLKVAVLGFICFAASFFINASDDVRTALFLIGGLALIIGIVLAIADAIHNRRTRKQTDSKPAPQDSSPETVAPVPAEARPSEAASTTAADCDNLEKSCDERYLFYDVETPNRHNNSICAVGWVLYEDNVKVSQGFQLIDPRAPFDAFLTRLHGISASAVNGKPTFGQYWADTLGALMISSVVVAHNASFDMSVTAKALAIEGIEMPSIKYCDSIPSFRALYPDMRYKLTELASYFGYKYQAHHAGEDAAMLADVISAACLEKGFISFSEFFEAATVKEEATQTYLSKDETGEPIDFYEKYEALIQQIISSAQDKHVDLSEIHFAFHGNLQNPVLYRKNGLDRIVEALGGVFHDGVSGKVDYYVCFDNDETNTVLKARSIANDPRYHLHIIDAEAFMALIGQGDSEPDHAGPAEIRARKQRERDAKEAAIREKELARALRETRKAEREALKAERKPRQPRGRAVRQLDKDGNLINQFPSISVAASTVGINSKSIHDVLSGKQKTAAGYRWESADADSDLDCPGSPNGNNEDGEELGPRK